MSVICIAVYNMANTIFFRILTVKIYNHKSEHLNISQPMHFQFISLMIILMWVYWYCVYHAMSKCRNNMQILLKSAERSTVRIILECALSHPCYTVIISYCPFYMNKVPGDCYLYICMVLPRYSYFLHQ